MDQESHQTEMPTEVAPAEQVAPDTTVIVDKRSLYRMINATIKGVPQTYAGYGGMVKLKDLFGLPEGYDECQKKWAEIQATLAKEGWV